MESITVKQGETNYILYNLTIERIRDFKNDSQKLTEYFTKCLQTRSNICIQQNEDNPSSMATSTSGQKTRKFKFLCGPFQKKNYIYAIKFERHPWHYFKKLDCIISQHNSLPASMNSLISGLDKVRSINVNLNEEQSKNYFYNGKFIFKNIELKTSMEFDFIQSFESSRQASSISNSEKQSASNGEEPPESKSTLENTARLVFVSGQTNPLLFLNQFEKCRDVKTTKDKIYKIRYFVDESHKAEFSRLYFAGSDWPTVKSEFLKLYSASFTRNKKRQLNIDFNEVTSLRSFVEQKMINLSKFTTLSLTNQMEIIINDLPVEISNLFITNEKITCNKSEILDFCESLQDFAETCVETEDVMEVDGPSISLNRMEIFNFSRDTSPPELSDYESMPVDESQQTTRGRGHGKLESSMSSEYDFLSQVSDSSRSTWSDVK